MGHLGFRNPWDQSKMGGMGSTSIRAADSPRPGATSDSKGQVPRTLYFNTYHMVTLSRACTQQIQALPSMIISIPQRVKLKPRRPLGGLALQPAATFLLSPGLMCTCWPCLTVALMELSLIWELISGIVREQGGHFISSLLWVLPALCSLHQPRPLAWALDIKLPVAAGNVPVRTFPFNNQTDWPRGFPCPHIPPLYLDCRAIARSESRSLPVSGDPSTGKDLHSGAQDSCAPSPFPLAGKALGAKPTKCSPEQAGRTLKRVSCSLKGAGKDFPSFHLAWCHLLFPPSLVSPALTHLSWKPPCSHEDDVSASSLCAQASF